MAGPRLVNPGLARRVTAIPSADLASLRRPWLVTTAVRLALAALLLALLVGALLVARGLQPREAAFLPQGTSVIVVLDVSQSVTDPVYRRVAKTLQRVSESKQGVGLIVFSDLAYELLPPGSPPAELKPLIRFYQPRAGFDVTTYGSMYPRNPWNETFSAGTQISDGLTMAKAVLRREQIANGSVLLLSDLDTAPSDEAALTRTLASFRIDGIELRVVPLFPNGDDRRFFQQLVGEDAMVTPQELGVHIGRRAGEALVGTTPRLLTLLGGLLVFALTTNEWWCRRVELPRRAE